MPPYTIQDIDELFAKGVITAKDRAALRIDFIQQNNQEEGNIRKLIGHLSHEVTEGWGHIKAGTKAGAKSTSLAEEGKAYIQVVAGALQVLSALPTAAGKMGGEGVQDFLVKRGANPTVAALAGHVADVALNVVAPVTGGAATVAKAATTARKAASDATVRKGIADWMEQTLLADKTAAVKKTAADIAKEKADKIAETGKLLDEAAQTVRGSPEEATSTAQTLDAAMQTLLGKDSPEAVVNAMSRNGQVRGAVRELNKMAEAVPSAEPAEGFVRVYRGQGTEPAALPEWAKTNAGQWFTSSKAKAQRFAEERSGVLKFVDIPRAEIDAYKAGSRTDEFLIPEIVQKNRGAGIIRGGREFGGPEAVGASARARQAFEEGAAKYESSRIKLADLEAKAKESNTSIADVLALESGQAKTPQEIANLSQPVKFYGEAFTKSVDRAEESLAKGDYKDFWQAMTEFDVLVRAHWPYMAPRQVAGQATKTYDEPVLSATRFLQQVPGLGSWMGKLKMNTPEEVEANAALILREMQKVKSPEQIANFSKRVATETADGGEEVLNDPTFRDKARFLFVNSLMSSSDTIGRNVSGNVAGALWHYPEKITSAVAAKALNPFLSAKHHLDGGHVSEANMFMSVWARSMWDASRYALTRQWDELHGMIPDEKALAGLLENRYDLKKFSTTGTTNPFSGNIGRVIGTPVAISQAADEVSRIALYRAAAGEQLYRNWVNSGSEIPWGQYLNEGLANVPPSVHDYGMRIAGEFTFSDRMSALGRGVSNLRELVPGTELIAPFVRTPDRLTAFQYNRSPVLSLISTRLHDELNSGDATVRAEAVGRILWANVVGSGLFVAAKTEAPDGMNVITGGGPTDRELANKLKNSGIHIPYSIYTPAGRVSFAGMQPIRGPLGLIADTAEIWDEIKNPSEASSLWDGIALGLTRNLFDTSYMKPLSDIQQVWDTPSRSSSALSRLGANVVKGFVEPAIVRQAFRQFDPTVKEASNFWEELTREVPGWGGPARRNLLTGEPVVNPPRLLADVPVLGWFLPTSPIQPATDAFAKKIYELKLKLPDFPETIGGGEASKSPFAYSGPLGEAREAKTGVPIPKELQQKGMAYAFGAEDFGQTLNDEAHQLVSDPEFSKLAPTDQAEAIKGIYHSRYGAARDKLLGDHPELMDAYEQKLQLRDAVRMPPEEREAFEQTLNPPAEEPVTPFFEEAPQ